MIIAEVGQNFEGDINVAKYMIQLAKENGADLVKFQLYDSVKLYGEKGHSELSKSQAFELFDFGRTNGIEVFFSVFDTERVKWCEEMGVKRYKVAYSQNRNKPLITACRSHNETIISANEPKDGCCTLYCIPRYPADISELSLSWAFPMFDGFSDHTIGLDAAKIALARGAQIIEKHFAVDHVTGVDAPWSMTPSELKELKRFEGVCKQCL